MNILMINPETPSTFYSFRNALKFISKKSVEPPLGLITVAAMLPDNWKVELVDLNVSPLRDQQIKWADFVFLSGMNVQIKSFKELVKKCNQLGVKVVAGGPMVTSSYQDFPGVDHFILNEAEITLPPFLNDLQEGNPREIYRTDDYPDLSLTPVPRWDLLIMKHYASMAMQYSRGCPYNCEFCSISFLNGREPRTKSSSQMLAELEQLYRLGWRGNIFIVDDNFIGNRKKLKENVLPAIRRWQEVHHMPFNFTTEVSINLADDDALITSMVSAGFRSTFIGIETPNTDSLSECGKNQNLKRDMTASVRKLQHHGLMVSGGFIVGFDHDPPTIFEQQIRFIQKSGIVTAMVGLLNAPTGTALFQRLKAENRLLESFGGDNMDGTTNIIPKMKYQHLVQGYKKILDVIYSQKEFYERLKLFLSEYQLPGNRSGGVNFDEFKALFKSLWFLGVVEKGKQYYWRLIGITLLKFPRKLPLAVTLAIYGFHFRRVVEKI